MFRLYRSSNMVNFDPTITLENNVCSSFWGTMFQIDVEWDYDLQIILGKIYYLHE